MKRLIILSFLFSSLFISCRHITGKRISGNGNIITRARPVGSFNGVNVSGGIDVYIKQDSVTALKIEADENLQEYVHVTVDENILEIKEENGYDLQSAKGIKVFVSGPLFRHVEASGACNIYSQNQLISPDPVSIDLSGASNIKMELKAPKIGVDLSGAGTITLKGEAKDFSVVGSGSTHVKCFDLSAQNTDIELSGAGNAELFASEKLNVHVYGAADVRYKGNATLSQEVSGAGSVKKADFPVP